MARKRLVAPVATLLMICRLVTGRRLERAGPDSLSVSMQADRLASCWAPVAFHCSSGPVVMAKAAKKRKMRPPIRVTGRRARLNWLVGRNSWFSIEQDASA